MAHLPLQLIKDHVELALRLTIKGRRGIGKHEEKFDLPLYEVDKHNGTFSLPRQYFFDQVQGLGWDWVDGTSFPLLDEPMEFIGELKDDLDQPAAVETLLRVFNTGKKYGGILKAPPGTGKTVLGLYMAAAMGTRTVVLVHSDFLMDQWVERIQQFLGVEAGIIQKDRWEIDRPIVVAMIQTLLSRGISEEVGGAFGMLISDECHRMGAKIWHQVIKHFKARFRLGLTATDYRKDGLDNVFLWHIGEVIYRLSPDTLNPKVFQIETGATLPRWIRDKRTAMRSKMISLLSKNAYRTNKILEELDLAIRQGRKIIVFSERLDMLHYMYDRLKDPENPKLVGKYIGGMTPEDRKKSTYCQVILSTYQYGREALDIPELDSIFLGTPISGIEQAIGRTLRRCDEKKRPLVVDFVDSTVPYLKGLGINRARQYRKLGYELLETVS